MQKIKASAKEVEIYDAFAVDLAHGANVVDRDTYELIIDSRRKELLKCWLTGKSGLILDYGCGDGFLSRFIKEELKNEVIGVDISGRMLKYASARGKGVNYLVADCHALPFRNGSLIAVVGLGIFHHLNLRAAIFECNRVLCEGGLLVAFEPNSLGLLAFIGRNLFKTRIHTPNEGTYTHWTFISEMRKNDLVITDTRFMSFLGFIFPFIWASSFARFFNFLKNFAGLFKKVDMLFEKLPIAKCLCWQLIIVGLNRNLSELHKGGFDYFG